MRRWLQQLLARGMILKCSLRFGPNRNVKLEGAQQQSTLSPGIFAFCCLAYLQSYITLQKTTSEIFLLSSHDTYGSPTLQLVHVLAQPSCLVYVSLQLKDDRLGGTMLKFWRRIFSSAPKYHGKSTTIDNNEA